jgi:hypothetical protein
LAFPVLKIPDEHEEEWLGRFAWEIAVVELHLAIVVVDVEMWSNTHRGGHGETLVAFSKIRHKPRLRQQWFFYGNNDIKSIIPFRENWAERDHLE